MRIKTEKYRLVLFLAIALFTGVMAYSQSMTQQNPSPELEEVAEEKRDMWTRELSLTDKQALLMEKKIIEFAMKKDELIQSKMREEAKTARLQELQELEIRDMRDILTKPQFETYLAIKQEQINQQNEQSQE